MKPQLLIIKREKINECEKSVFLVPPLTRHVTVQVNAPPLSLVYVRPSVTRRNYNNQKRRFNLSIHMTEPKTKTPSNDACNSRWHIIRIMLQDTVSQGRWGRWGHPNIITSQIYEPLFTTH